MCYNENNIVPPAKDETEEGGEERQVNPEEQDAKVDHLEDREGEDGERTDDAFMVFGHDDVAWTGTEPNHLCINLYEENIPLSYGLT
jgi:hypothetical protein